MAKIKDPLVPLPMRAKKSMIARLDQAAIAWKTTRTAVTLRLINDGFKWWAREDLEQDTTLAMVAQIHERTATILAMQNVMAETLGLYDKDPEFGAKVADAKRAIMRERERGNATRLDGPDGSAVE